MKKALGDNHNEMKSNENEENSVIAEILIRTIKCDLYTCDDKNISY